jgi:hypothetical protein
VDIKYEDLPDLSKKKETNNEKKILVEETAPRFSKKEKTDIFFKTQIYLTLQFFFLA